MGKKDGTYELTCTAVLKNTGKALLCVTKEHGDIWVPQAQIHEDSEVFDVDQDGKLIVTEWFAIQKNWV